MTILSKRRPMINGLLAGMLVLIIGCGKSTEGARRELALLNIDYTATAFVNAVKEGDQTAVSLFLQAGMSSNLTYDKDSIPVLCFAIANNHPEIAKQLLKYGANPDQPFKDGVTPLILAVAKSSPESVKILLDKKADPNLKIGDNMLPLRQACLDYDQLNPKIVKLLLDAGADVDAGSKSGGTALIACCENTNLALAKLNLEVAIELLNAGAAVNYADSDGETALMMAAYYGNSGIVSILLTHGANAKTTSKKGLTAIDYALVGQERCRLQTIATLTSVQEPQIKDRTLRDINSRSDGLKETIQLLNGR